MQTRGSAEDHTAWSHLLKLDETATAKDMIKASLAAGDSVMTRIWHHVQADGGRIDEQIDKNSGAQVSLDLSPSPSLCLTSSCQALSSLRRFSSRLYSIPACNALRHYPAGPACAAYFLRCVPVSALDADGFILLCVLGGDGCWVCWCAADFRQRAYMELCQHPARAAHPQAHHGATVSYLGKEKKRLA